MIKVQIADDNIDFTVLLANYLTKDDDIKVLSTSLNGEDAIHIWKTLRMFLF